MSFRDIEEIPAERCGMAWTEEETAILVDLLDHGGSPANAFGRIGRGEDAIKRKWRKLAAKRSSESKKLESTCVQDSAASSASIRNRQYAREADQSLIVSHQNNNDEEEEEEEKEEEDEEEEDEIANEWEVLSDSVSEGDDGPYLPTWSSDARQLRKLHMPGSTRVPMPGAACEDCRRKHKRCDHRAMSISTPSKSTTTSHLTHGELEHYDEIVGHGVRSCRQGTVRVPSPERVDLFRSVQNTTDSAAPRKMTTVSHKCISSDEVTVLQAISEAAMNEVHPISQQGSQMQSSTGLKKRGRPRKVRVSDQARDSQMNESSASHQGINSATSQMLNPSTYNHSVNVQEDKTCLSNMYETAGPKVTKSSKVKTKRLTMSPPRTESKATKSRQVKTKRITMTPPHREPVTFYRRGKIVNPKIVEASRKLSSLSGKARELMEDVDVADENDQESTDDSRSSSPFEWTNVRPREPQLQTWSEDTPPLIPPCPPLGPIWSINRPYSSVRDEPLPPPPENDPSKYYLPRPRRVPAAEDKQTLDSPANREERDTMSEHL